MGEGNYRLSSGKQITGTEAYFALAEKTKLCQNVESFQECQTRKFYKSGLVKCKCTPYKLKKYSEHQVAFQ